MNTQLNYQRLSHCSLKLFFFPPFQPSTIEYSFWCAVMFSLPSILVSIWGFGQIIMNRHTEANQIYDLWTNACVKLYRANKSQVFISEYGHRCSPRWSSGERLGRQLKKNDLHNEGSQIERQIVYLTGLYVWVNICVCVCVCVSYACVCLCV